MFQLLVASTRLKYSYVCQPVTYVNTQEELRVSSYTYHLISNLAINDCFLERLDYKVSIRWTDKMSIGRINNRLCVVLEASRRHLGKIGRHFVRVDYSSCHSFLEVFSYDLTKVHAKIWCFPRNMRFMPIGFKLMNPSISFPDSQRRLVVLLLQTPRVLRHLLLHSAQEGCAVDVSPRLPSQHHVLPLVDWH